MHATLKRNFQVMPGAKWLELLLAHIPDKHEHLVRYYGAYSSRYRGEHQGEEEARENTESAGLEIVEPDTELRRRARAAWAKLIYRVYEIDPLICPWCDAEMRVIEVIHDGAAIRKILASTDRWPVPACLGAVLGVTMAVSPGRASPRGGHMGRRRMNSGADACNGCYVENAISYPFSCNSKPANVLVNFPIFVLKLPEIPFRLHVEPELRCATDNATNTNCYVLGDVTSFVDDL